MPPRRDGSHGRERESDLSILAGKSPAGKPGRGGGAAGARLSAVEAEAESREDFACKHDHVPRIFDAVAALVRRRPAASAT